LEELDVIQADLETLLANAGKRLKVLENEMQILTNWQEKSGEIKPIAKVKGGKVVSSSVTRINDSLSVTVVAPIFVL
jgi:hypothetical protein